MPTNQRFTNEEEEESPAMNIRRNKKKNKRRKLFKICGILQIIAGTTTLTIGLLTGGILIIPVVIGGYFIANGLLNTVIKI